MATEIVEWAGGEVLFAGCTDYVRAGGRAGGHKGKKTPAEIKDDEARAVKYPNLYAPTRFKALQGIKVKWIASGAAACHSVIGDADGRCWTWGRNEKGQLGHGDLCQRNIPMVVEALKGLTVTAGAAGKHHSVVVTSSGDSWAFGLNSTGQLGTGSVKNKGKIEDVIMKPAKSVIVSASKVAAGIDFTVWLCNGRVFSAGNPQFGQLGHGTDHEYNASDSSVKIMYEPQPMPAQVAGLAGSSITQLACGHNHTLVIDSDGMGFTWGNGGYGRLGQNVQKDEFTPKRLEPLVTRIKCLPDGIAACGTTSSFCTVTAGTLYGWGKLKVSGDNHMYPRPFEGLMGWTIHSMSCGSQHFAVSAEYQKERSTITWGHAQYGELGYGDNGKKSSANPDKCQALEGVATQQVACGVSHTLFLVDPEAKQLADLKMWEPEVDIEEEVKPVAKPAPKPPAKRKAGAAAGGKSKK